MSITIKDVARLAGVSPSTVSRTCTNHPSISKQTKAKVRKAMQELGYEPNFQASNLASRNSRTIGIILPDSESEVYQNSFYLEAIRGIGQFCNQKQYMNTLITGSDEKEVLQVIKTMLNSGRADGFIVLYSKRDDEVLEYLYDNGITYVLIGKATVNPNQVIYIDNDNIQAAKEATDYLIQLGHEKIAFLGTDNNSMFIQDRKNGYMMSLMDHNIPVHPEYFLEQDFLQDENDGSLDNLRNLLMSENAPTAILVSDDILAVALEKVLIELGIRVPEQLSIISFNNSLFAKLTNPPLTSVDINSYQLGIEAASQIINHIENPNLLATKIIVPHRIIERNSCLPL
ncbi:MAG: LacI family transcriptional regulator [Lachnospiraceae bacterium]|nr:LacI family transcriptional regulator [Lachnospiraceae bacterium]